MKNYVKLAFLAALAFSVLALSPFASDREAAVTTRTCSFNLQYADGLPDTLSHVYGRICVQQEHDGMEEWELDMDTSVVFAYTDTARVDSAGFAQVSWTGAEPSLCVLIVNGLKVEGPFEDGQTYEVTTP